ncbi:MAG: hypothetical protein ABR548_08675 [Actinomycetota bacterium]|nr:hypothetical protein [Actinomycetota bacterium]
MARKLSEEIHEGDPVSIALRGGAGWLTGVVVWVHDEQMLIQHKDMALQADTPYVLIDLREITGIALPRQIEPPAKPSTSPGFMR